MPSSPAAVATGKRTLAALTGFGVIAPLTFLVSPVLTPQLGTQLSLPPHIVGLLMGGELLGAALVTLPAVFVLRRRNWHTTAWFTCLVFCLANLLSAQCSDWRWLLSARMVAGAAGGMLAVITLLTAARSVNPPKSFAWWVGAQTVVSALGLTTLPWLFAHAGIAALYYFLAGAVLIMLPLVKGFPAHMETATTPATHATTDKSSAAWNLTAIFLFYVSIGGAWAFAGIPGTGAGLSEMEVGRITALAMLLAAAGSILAARLGQTLRRTLYTLIAYALLAVCLWIIVESRHYATYAVAIIALQIMWSFILPMLLAALANSDHSGNGMIVSNMIIGLGAATGPLLGGYVLDHWQRYGAIANVSIVTLVMSGALFWFAAPPRNPGVTASADNEITS